MTTRKTMVEDMQGMEDILLALDGLHPEIPEKAVIRALARALWHILEYLVRRDNERQVQGVRQGNETTDV